MSEVQAVEVIEEETTEIAGDQEVDNQLDENQVDEDLEDNQAIEEVEIVSDNEESPPSKRRPNGFEKRIKRLNSKVVESSKAADEAVNRAAMLEEENKLLRLQAQQAQPVNKRPDELDFDSTAEYQEALDAYERARIAEAVNKQVAEATKSNQAQASQSEQERQFRGRLEKHYERADTLKMPNYEELEDKAIDILGNDLAKAIMQNSARSHLILGHLGVNTGAAYEIAELLKSDPAGAYTKAIELGAGLTVKSKHSPAPNPETKVEGGASVSSWQSKLERAREKAAQTGDMSKLLELKKEARDAGVALR